MHGDAIIPDRRSDDPTSKDDENRPANRVFTWLKTLIRENRSAHESERTAPNVKVVSTKTASRRGVSPTPHMRVTKHSRAAQNRQRAARRTTPLRAKIRAELRTCLVLGPASPFLFDAQKTRARRAGTNRRRAIHRWCSAIGGIKGVRVRAKAAGLYWTRGHTARAARREVRSLRLPVRRATPSQSRSTEFSR